MAEPVVYITYKEHVIYQTSSQWTFALMPIDPTLSLLNNDGIWQSYGVFILNSLPSWAGSKTPREILESALDCRYFDDRMVEVNGSPIRYSDVCSFRRYWRTAVKTEAEPESRPATYDKWAIALHVHDGMVQMSADDVLNNLDRMRTAILADGIDGVMFALEQWFDVLQHQLQELCESAGNMPVVTRRVVRRT